MEDVKTCTHELNVIVEGLVTLEKHVNSVSQSKENLLFHKAHKHIFSNQSQKSIF